MTKKITAELEAKIETFKAFKALANDLRFGRKSYEEFGAEYEKGLVNYPTLQMQITRELAELRLPSADFTKILKSVFGSIR